MKIKGFTIFGMLFALFQVTTFAQELKIGVIDMQRLTDEYYKTKQHQKEIDERRTEIQETLNEQRDKLNEMVTQIENLFKVINDDSTTEEFKRLKAVEHQSKVNEARDLERKIEEYRMRMENQLRDHMRRTTRMLLSEIKEIVDAKAREDNYDFVINKTAQGTLLYSKDAYDFTNAVILLLNKDAPAEEEATETSSEEDSPKEEKEKNE